MRAAARPAFESELCAKARRPFAHDVKADMCFTSAGDIGGVVAVPVVLHIMTKLKFIRFKLTIGRRLTSLVSIRDATRRN